MKPVLRVLLGSVAFGAILARCSWVTPEVGQYRGACGEGAAYTKPAGGYAGGAGASAGVDPRCLPGSGTAAPDNACDNCANAHCCAERFGCYDDMACACADETLDGCLDEAEGVGADDAGETVEGGDTTDGAVSGGSAPINTEKVARVVKCWSDFAASGAAAKARIACQRTSCRDECEVPDF